MADVTPRALGQLTLHPGECVLPTPLAEEVTTPRGSPLALGKTIPHVRRTLRATQDAYRWVLRHAHDPVISLYLVATKVRVRPINPKNSVEVGAKIFVTRPQIDILACATISACLEVNSIVCAGEFDIEV